MRISVLLVALILSLSVVSAIGVTPGKSTIKFESGATISSSFKIINSESGPVNIALSKQGELGELISFGDSGSPLSILSVPSGEEGKEVRYSMTMPQELSPGSHFAEIVVLQLPDTQSIGEAVVGATVAVVAKVQVDVPYPGKYAEAGLNIINAEAGGDATFIIPVVNRGRSDIVDAKAQVDIYNQLNERVDSFTTSSIQVPQESRKELVHNWNADVPVGKYRASVALVYDGETLNLEKQFSVGVASLEIRQIEVNDFSLGQIAKFDMIVENGWSEPISGAYSQIQIFDGGGNIIADFKSAQYDLQALQRESMSLFWDTAGFSEGSYSATISLYYGDSSSRNDVTFEVSQNDIQITGLGYVISSEDSPGLTGFDSLTVVLIVIIVVLVMINALWFLILRKKLHKKK